MMKRTTDYDDGDDGDDGGGGGGGCGGALITHTRAHVQPPRVRATHTHTHSLARVPRIKPVNY